MRGAPGLHPGDMHRVAEVVLVLRLGQPRGLTGGLAGASTVRLAAVPVTLADAMVNIKKVLATQALTLPRLGHGPLPDRVDKRNPIGHVNALEGSLKKKEINPEEDGSGRKRSFKPAETRQIRTGGHIPPTSTHRRTSLHTRGPVRASAEMSARGSPLWHGLPHRFVVDFATLRPYAGGMARPEYTRLHAMLATAVLALGATTGLWGAAYRVELPIFTGVQ